MSSDASDIPIVLVLKLVLFLLLAVALQPAAALPSALQQGLLALRDGKLLEARTSFESAVQIDPKNAIAWASLAETSRRLGDHAAATDAAQKAERVGSEVPVVDHALASFYLNEGQFAHAAALEEKYALSPKADAQAPLRTAELYQRAGDTQDAERVLKAAWEKRGVDPLLAFNYAQLLLQKLDFVAAERAVAAAAAAHPNDPQLILVTGVARYGQRRFSDAMDEFLKVIGIDPDIPQPYEFLGKMLEQAGPKLPAITQALQARVKTKPDDPLASLVLAKAMLLTDSRNPSAGLLLRHSLSIDPEQWEAHYELGVLLENEHDFPAAMAELKRSIALNDKQAMSHYHLARVYDRLGDTLHAIEERKLHQDLSNTQQ